MNEIGARILQGRKERELSQADLASKAGISQAAVSRIENGDDLPQDIRVLAKLAKALKVPLPDLTDGTPLAMRDHRFDGDHFWAFCPNPMCDKNRAARNPDGSASVTYSTYRQYPVSEFEETNFCATCGTDLVKECHNCNRRIDSAAARFCVRCGAEITTRPTRDEWKKILERAPLRAPPPPPPTADDDIPF